MKTNNRPIGHVEVVDISGLLVADDRTHIYIADCCAYHRRFGLIIGEDFNLGFLFLRFFKIEPISGDTHFLLKPPNGLAEVSTEQRTDFTDLMVIVGFTLFPHTSPQAVSDMIFQANFIVFGFNRFWSQVIGAISKGVEILNEIHQQSYGLKIGEWTKILRSVFLDFARGKYPRECFFFNTDPRVGFIVT